MPSTLVELGELVLSLGGSGIEVQERPFNQGAYLRIWLPDEGAVNTLNMVTIVGGLRPTKAMRHLRDAFSTSYNGWQVVIPIPLTMIDEARAAAEEVRQLASNPKELEA